MVNLGVKPTSLFKRTDLDFYTVWLYMQKAEDGDLKSEILEKYVYYFQGGNENAQWPGTEITTYDSDKFTFTTTVPATVDAIIFNNGGKND